MFESVSKGGKPMKRIYNRLYNIWAIVSFTVCGFMMIFLYPEYPNNEFPLYTDLTLMLFLPSLFIVSYLLSHILSGALSNKKNLSDNLILLVKLSFIFISFVLSLMFMEFSWEIRIIFSVTFFIVSIPHFIITKILYSKSLQ